MDGIFYDVDPPPNNKKLSTTLIIMVLPDMIKEMKTTYWILWAEFFFLEIIMQVSKNILYKKIILSDRKKIYSHNQGRRNRGFRGCLGTPTFQKSIL